MRRKKVPLGSALYSPYPLSVFPALSICPAWGPHSPHGVCSGPANNLLSPQARPSPKGLVMEFTGPPQGQTLT